MFQGMTAVNPMHLARRLSIVPLIWHQVRSRSKHRIRLPMIFARLHESIFQSHFREITNWSHHLHILWLRGCLHRFKPVAYQHSSFILKFSKITFFLASSRELVDWNYFVTFPSFNGSWIKLCTCCDKHINHGVHPAYILRISLKTVFDGEDFGKIGHTFCSMRMKNF